MAYTLGTGGTLLRARPALPVHIYNLHDHNEYRVKRHDAFKSDITDLP